MTNLSKPQTKLELLALFGKSRDQDLDLAEAELLNSLLISDSSIRGLYRGFIAIESGLEEIAKIQISKSVVTNSDMAIIDDTIAEIPVAEIPVGEIPVAEPSDPAINKHKK